jgi:hypothetical protein
MQRRQLGIWVASTLLCAGTAGATGPEVSPFSARVEGYLGGAVLDPESGDEVSGLDGGGTGSAVARMGPLFLQADVFGDYADFDPDARNVGGGGHLGLVDPELGAIGATGGYQEFQLGSVDDELYRVGGEAEFYAGPVTLGVNAGYLNADLLGDDGYYARGLVRFYPTENLKLEGVGGVSELDDDVIPHARALVEYRPEGWPLGIFARWEGAIENPVDQHFAVAGLRLYLDGFRFGSDRTLRELDRTYFREACFHTLFATRTC